MQVWKMVSSAVHVIPHAKPKYTSGCGMNVRHSFLPILTIVVYNVFFPHISCALQNYDSWENGLPLSYCGICFFHICNMRVHKVSWWNWIYLLLYLYHTPLVSVCNTPGCRACKFAPMPGLPGCWCHPMIPSWLGYLQGSMLWSRMVAGRRWGFLPVLFSRWWGRRIFPGMYWCGHHKMSRITLNSEAMGCRLTSQQRTKCDAGWWGKAGVVMAVGIDGNGGWDHTLHVALLYLHGGAHPNFGDGKCTVESRRYLILFSGS